MYSSHRVPALLLMWYCLCITINARSRGYETILGQHAVNRYCGMEDDVCLNDFGCCPEYQCNGRKMCQLRGELRFRTTHMGKSCTTDYDCKPGLCCLGSLYNGHCTENCERIDNIQPVPPVGYYGQRFWNMWARNHRAE
ncbi:unnamed protein product [Dicrocoelium dendriticum]|nr:unnamed protein product [Dicrocoelium dendriticum]